MPTEAEPGHSTGAPKRSLLGTTDYARRTRGEVEGVVVGGGGSEGCERRSRRWTPRRSGAARNGTARCRRPFSGTLLSCGIV